ncbi:MAG: hypothetical protein ACLP7O_11950 [Terracidiphilus sp.]
MNDISHNIVNENPDAIANRLINKAEYRDGLQEIVIGLISLTFAGMAGLPAVFKGSFGSMASLWGMMLLMSIIGFGSQWAIKKMRKRFLIGKVGYVKLKPVNRKRLGIRLGIILGLSFVIAALAAFAMVKVAIATHKSVAHWGLFPPAGWALVGTGIFAGAIMVFRVRLLRYVIGGVIMVAMGILLAFSRVSINLGLTILYGFAGLLALISGSVVFFLFLRQPAGTGE